MSPGCNYRRAQPHRPPASADDANNSTTYSLRHRCRGTWLVNGMWRKADVSHRANGGPGGEDHTDPSARACTAPPERRVAHDPLAGSDASRQNRRSARRFRHRLGASGLRFARRAHAHQPRGKSLAHARARPDTVRIEPRHVHRYGPGSIRGVRRTDRVRDSGIQHAWQWLLRRRERAMPATGSAFMS